MTGDDRPRALPVPGAIDHLSGGRGGADERAVDSVKRAFDHARTRAIAPAATDDTADAVERRRLITEIRTMRRYRVNVAFEGVITGALYTGGAWALYRLARWLLDELRSPPTATLAPAPQTTQPIAQPAQPPTSRTP